MLTGCSSTAYVSQCKWAREIRMPNELKADILSHIDDNPDPVIQYQGRIWIDDIGDHNDNVKKFCYINE